MPTAEAASLPDRAPPSPTPPNTAIPDWQPAAVEHSLPGDKSDGRTYFRDLGTTREGTFAALYESFLDNRDTVTGTFQVAQFRYVYSIAVEASGAAYPEHDELITTALVDCSQHLFGTLSTEYLLHGVSWGVTVDADADILMVQMTQPSTAIELCRFLAR